MRILFSTCSAAHYMAPPQLADEQVNCGPFFQDREIGGRFVSLATPKGEYDLAAVAARLPADQQPDVVVCLVDASWFNQPKNLAALKCPKVVLVADTHHMNKPVTGMLSYPILCHAESAGTAENGRDFRNVHGGKRIRKYQRTSVQMSVPHLFA